MSIQSRVVVGVYPGQPDGVVLQAALFAARFGAELVCAWVDSGRHPRADLADRAAVALTEQGAGTATADARTIDPSPATASPAPFDPYLAAHLARILGGHDIDWSTRQLSGDPAQAIDQLAESLHAAMIVVGTRNSAVRGSLQEFFVGSIAMHLAHRQKRPVVVIPLAPVSFGDAQWESD